jgi:hypothetical protein
MPITYSNAFAAARLEAVLDLLAGGSLEIGTAGFGAVLAQIPLASPAGSVTNKVLTLTMPASDTDANADGTAAAARIKDSGGTAQITGLTVGVAGSGADIIMNSVAIAEHAAVTISAATITHP